jgi:hypothetical protein
MHFCLSEGAARMWDAITKGVSVLGLIAGGIWTLRKYFDDRANSRKLDQERAKSAEIEARKPFASKQLDLYFAAVEAASAIASGPWEQQGPQIDAFWRLYWGPLALVEDSTVAKAMIQFGDALKDNAEQTELRIYALELAHACRDAIAQSWNVSLSSLEAERFGSPGK